MTLMLLTSTEYRHWNGGYWANWGNNTYVVFMIRKVTTPFISIKLLANQNQIPLLHFYVCSQLVCNGPKQAESPESEHEWLHRSSRWPSEVDGYWRTWEGIPESNKHLFCMGHDRHREQLNISTFFSMTLYSESPHLKFIWSYIMQSSNT